MIIANFGLSEYIFIVGATFVLILADGILTLINSKMTANYHMYEVLPHIAYLYKKYDKFLAATVHILSSIIAFLVFFFIPIRITNLLIVFGIMLYRVWHCGFRIYLIRRSQSWQKK